MINAEHTPLRARDRKKDTEAMDKLITRQAMRRKIEIYEEAHSLGMTVNEYMEMMK